MTGETANVVGGIVGAKFVQHQERIERVQGLGAQGPVQVDTGAVRGGLSRNRQFQRANFHGHIPTNFQPHRPEFTAPARTYRYPIRSVKQD